MVRAEDKILVLNLGSSSIKASLYGDIARLAARAEWQADVDLKSHKIKLRSEGAGSIRELSEDERQVPVEVVIRAAIAQLSSGERIRAAGHRVVHGGYKYSDSVIVDSVVEEDIERFAEFAPLHNPINLRGIQAVKKLLGCEQVVVFDTAFHHNLPLAARTYALPYELCDRLHVRRYGFHGISVQYCMRRAAAVLGRSVNDLNLIVCHLGNGCSISAVKSGVSIDTSMGFTPLEGLVMGTRSGSVDPGLLIYLLKKHQSAWEWLEQILDRKSGLLGLSGQSSDMREIVAAAESGDAQARLAFDVFVHSVVSHVGSMLPHLGGADALIFAGGIGENAAGVRSAVCQAFAFAGCILDESLNQAPQGDCLISTPASGMAVLRVETDENALIAAETARLLSQ